MRSVGNMEADDNDDSDDPDKEEVSIVWTFSSVLAFGQACMCGLRELDLVKKLM